MHIQQLTYVLTVAQTGSMNKAAQKLYISQPNLSNSIRNLEKELNITIFNHTSKGVETTREGKLLIKYARSILGQIDQLKNIYDTVGNEENFTVLEISQNKSIYLTDLITNLYNPENTHIKVSLNLASTSDVINDVFHRKSEIGVIALSSMQKILIDKILEHKSLEFIPIQTSNVCTIMSHTCPMASKSKISIEDLKSLVYVGYLDDSSSFLKYSIDLSENWYSSPTGNIFVNDLESMRNLLHSINSYSFDLTLNKSYLTSKNLLCKPLIEDIEVMVGYIKRKNDVLLPQTDLFVKELMRQYSYNS